MPLCRFHEFHFSILQTFSLKMVTSSLENSITSKILKLLPAFNVEERTKYSSITKTEIKTLK